MGDRWVLNASPLIALGSIGQIALLEGLADDLVVPPAVAAEVLRGQDAASHAVADAGFLRMLENVAPDVTVVAWGLGAGETEVITFARENTAYEAVIDDLTARRCARSLSIPIRGTLGVVLLAKHRGFVASAGALIDDLLNAGFYLSPEIVAAALSLVGEQR